jgi:hypothetical protein
MIPLGVLCQRQSGMQKVLELLFNAADGGSIVDSTGRHSPSLSASGTHGIVGNRLNVASGGYIRADAENVASADFDFSSSDFSVECRVTAYSSSTYVWIHTASDGDFGLCLRYQSDYQITVRSASNSLMMSYNSATSLIGVEIKAKVERIADRYALIIDDVEVDSVIGTSQPVGSNGFLIGLGLTGTIDDFIVRKS